MRPLPILVAALASLTAVAPAIAGDCAAPTEAEVRQLHDRWVQSLATMHPDKVLRNYAPDAVFVGLDTATPLADVLAIRNYYVYFLQREPKIAVQNRVIRSGCATASDIGALTVSARPKGNAPYEPLTVRYSVNYEQRDGKWLIVQHHLSVAEVPHAAPPVATSAPAAPAPAVAGFIKRLPAPKKPVAPAANPATEQLVGGWTYTPGVWRDDKGPQFQGD